MLQHRDSFMLDGTAEMMHYRGCSMCLYARSYLKCSAHVLNRTPWKGDLEVTFVAKEKCIDGLETNFNKANLFT